ncbi:MAG: ATP-dependent Clp protease ATP-binding subunit [Candidatus Magasanikbacteria bacterium]
MDAQKLIDNFSNHLKNVIAKAISLATFKKSEMVEPIDIFYSLFEEKGGIASGILKKFELDEKLTKKVFGNLKKEDRTIQNATHIPELSSKSRSLIEKSLITAHEHKHAYIGTEHLLYALVYSKNPEIKEIFTSLEIDTKYIKDQLTIVFANDTRFSAPNKEDEDFLNNLDEDFSEEITPMMPPPMPAPQKMQKKMSALVQFTTNLTSKAEQQNIDEVVGRDSEIERIINILARRTKNNPILVGEPGVGKTAIVEGLAKKIAEGKVPDILKKKQILSLDLTLLVAGTIYRGEFEARLKQIIDECSSNQNYILFIDELHNIIGAGSNQGTMDAANILKPALARGRLHCIGATTYDEYKKYISQDPALERRFQKVDVEEPSTEETIQILQGLKKYYEKFHNVIIETKTIEEAVALSNRYVHDNFQPDKAIDLIDEASGFVRSKQKSSKEDLQIFALEQKISNITDKKNIAIAEEKLKEAIKLKKEIEKIGKQVEKIKSLNTKKIPSLKVTPEHIRNIVSQKMHIEKTILGKNEWEILDSLENNLNKKIIGQTEAINKTVRTLKSANLRLQKNKPFASLLLVGPSGVGKTELAKTLAEELYHDEKALVKLDMSEFSESHSVSKLLGSPAGYIGYKDRNPFFEKIKNRPYSVILLDEIDKAHKDVLKLLLQMLDEGTITDNQGKKIKLNHSVIIMTTNVGSEIYKNKEIGFGEEKSEKQKNLQKQVENKLKEYLEEAILSRLSNIIIFKSLEKDAIIEITKNNISQISKQLEENQKISLTSDDKAITELISQIKYEEYGARNVLSKLSEVVQDLIIENLKNKKTKKKYTLTYEKNYKLI